MIKGTLVLVSFALLLSIAPAFSQSTPKTHGDSAAVAPVHDSASAAAPAPATAQSAVSVPAATHIEAGAKLFIERSEFGMALAAAILKKKVPVVSMTDSIKSEFFVHTASNERVEKGGERIAKALVLGAWMGSGTHFNATVTITNRDGAVIFAHNSKKDNFQSAAENVAAKLKKEIETSAKSSK